MARKTKTTEGATGTVQARLTVEADRQAAARAVRDELAAETAAAQKATAKRLKDKPTDSRTLVA